MIKSFNMATMPQRKNNAILSINSIYDQADIIRLYLNNFDEVPVEFIDDKIEIINNSIDLKSSGKLFWALNSNEYYFCIDDDILYPRDYAEYMISKLNQYNDDVIVSLHGRVMKVGKIESYFKDTVEYYHFKLMLESDRKVDIIGNGVSCWNTNNIFIDYNKFKYHFMDDILVSLQAREQNKDRIVVEHENGYMKDLKPLGFTLFDKYRNNDNLQTEMINSIIW